MFRKLKEKIVENSPQRLQFSQLVGDNRLPNPPVPEDSFFSISEDDANTSASNMEPGYTSVPLVSPQETRYRRSSTSSMASDVSFLPRYESSSNMYQLQSDLDISASELEDNVSTSSQIGQLSKEQIYSAFKKTQMRYHKYRGRYTDLAKHYKDLERENSKMKSILVETQDKAIRRVTELKEQCSLEEKAKAHLEGVLRDELDEKQFLIESLQTKIRLLQNGSKESDNEADPNSVNNANRNTQAQKNAEELETLRKYLTDARQEIEKLNEKLQEVKANNIILNSKEQDYKIKISKLEKEISDFSEREKENNLKLAQSKMELHNELISKDSDLNNLRRDNEILKQNIEALETNNMKNLQAQNKKLIEKIENLNEKYSNYDCDLLKLEQYKIEIKGLHDTMSDLKRRNEELLKQTTNEDNEKKSQNLIAEVQLLQDTVKNLNESNNNLVTELSNQREEYEKQIVQIREDAKKALISLEGKIKEKLSQEFTTKETELKATFQQKIDSVMSNELDSKEIQLKLVESLQLIEQLKNKIDLSENEIRTKEAKYKDLEKNHLDLINESSNVRSQLSQLEKQVENLKHEIFEKDYKIKELQQHYSILEEELSSCRHVYEVLQKDQQSLQEERLGLIEDNATLKEKFRMAEEKLECVDLENNEIQLLSLKLKSLEEENVRLLEDLQYQKDCFDKVLRDNTRLKPFEEKVASLEKDLAESSEQLSKLKDLTDKRDDENIAFSKEQLELQKTIKNLEEQVAIYKDKEETCIISNNECCLLEMKIQKLEEEKQSIVEAFEMEKSMYLSKEQKYEEKLSGYKTSVDDIDKLYSEQKEKSEKLEKEIHTIHEEKDIIKRDYEEKINQIEIETGDLKKENDNMNILLEETKLRLSEYQNNSTDQQKNYEIKLDGIMKENKKAKAIIKKDKEHIEVLNKDIEQKIRELERVIAERSEAESLCEKQGNRLKELENLLKTKETESIAQIKKEKEYQNELIQKLQEFEKTISQKDDAFVNLEKKLQELEKIFNSEKEQLEQQLQDLRAIESLYSSITEENARLKEEISRLRKLEEYIEDMVKQKADDLSKLQSLEDSLTHLKVGRQKYEEDMNKLKKIEKDYDILDQEKKAIEQELSNIKLIDGDKLSKIKLIEEAKQKLEADVSSISNDYKNIFEKNKELTDQLNRYSTLETDLKNALNKGEELTNEIVSLQNEIKNLNAEQSTIKNENEESQENKLKKLNAENEVLKENCSKLSEEITQLQLNNNLISSDNKHITEENSNLFQELETTKLKIEILEESINENIALKNNLQKRNEELEQKYSQIKKELEGLKVDGLKEAQLNHSSPDELLRIQQDFYEMKQTCDSFFLENKNLKIDLGKLEERYDTFDKTKKQYESQISELEKQYSDLMHENQLLQDEIQELKISPINLQNTANITDKLDNLEIIKQEQALNIGNLSNDKYLQEIESLREKVTKYKSLDITNKTSIEFYENELQKLKNKNEKLNQKLDETLVTLSHCTELSHSTEIEYLKNVLYNYMLGKEGLVLARVIAAVCKFDPQQTETILQKEQQKQTLLGQLGIL